MIVPLTIVVPSKTRDFLHHLLASLNAFQRGWQHEQKWRMVVADNGLPREYTEFLVANGIKVVGVPDPFCFSKAVNSAVALGIPNSHIVVMNDDASFTSMNPLETIGEVIERGQAEGFGVIGTVVNGGVGNIDQSFAQRPTKPKVIRETRMTVCFVCALIPRPVWDKVGIMDETFTGYGYDDNDYCNRVLRAGYNLGVSSDLIVSHGIGLPYSSTYGRLYDGSEIASMTKKAKKIYMKKWGHAGMTIR